MNAFDHLIRNLPAGTIHKLSYAWVGAVFLFPWSPAISVVLAVTALLAVVIPMLQRRVWEADLQREHTVVYVDRPSIPLLRRALNLALAFVGSAILAYLLDGQLGMAGLAWFLITLGLFVFQLDERLFGAPTVYLVTTEGIGIIHSTVRLFLSFAEIEQILAIADVDELPARWAVMAPTASPASGVLLVPVDRAGFTRLVDHVLTTPQEPDRFLHHVPPGLLGEAA